MALGAPSVNYSVNGTPTGTLANGQSASVASGILLSLSLVSAVGVNACTYTIRAPGTTYDGQNLPALSANNFAIVLQLPVTPTTYNVSVAITDGENVTVSNVAIIATNAGIVVTPAAQFGQAPVWSGSGYTPAGVVPCHNVYTYFPPGGNPSVDSWYTAIQAACDAAAVDGLPVYLPGNNYHLEQPVRLPSNIWLIGDPSPRGSPKTILNYQDHTGLFWGQGHVGDVVVAVPATSVMQFYTVIGGLTWLQMGGSSPTSALPHVFLTEAPMGSFQGMGALTFEFKLHIVAFILGTAFFEVSGSMTQNSSFTTCLTIGPTTSSGPTNITASLHTTGGTLTATSSTNPLTVGVDHDIRAVFDGQTLYLYVDGTKVANSTTLGGPATIIHNWYEDAAFGQSQAHGAWPMANTAPFDADKIYIAEIRKSRIARSTGSTYTPKATKWAVADCDTDTDLIISWDAAFIPTRTATMFVAGCGHPGDFGAIVSGPANVWMNVRNVSPAGDGGARGVGCALFNIGMSSWNGCMQVENATGVRTYDCHFSGRKGITRVNNSYYGSDHRPTFASTGGPFTSNPASAHSWGRANITDCGLGVCDDASFISCNSHVGFVSLASPEVLRDPKINTVNGQCGFYFNNSAVYVIGGGCGDEGGHTLIADVIVTNNSGPPTSGQGQTTTWIAGNFLEQNGSSTTCSFLIDGGTNYDINADMGVLNSSACIKAVSAPAYPVKLRNCTQGQGIQAYAPWSDGTVDVLVDPLETNGRDGDALTSSATSFTLPWAPLSGRTHPDFSCAVLVFKGSPTGDVTATPPTNAKGHRRRVVNALTTVHNVVFGGVTVANGKSAYVESNGSGWERATPDT